jgi:ABC-type cobalamin/Fe3+-siderophores transport system ATPase subunit
MLKCWIKEGGKSAIVTLHDPLLAMRYCDCLLLLKEGEIFEQLSPGADSLDKMEKALSCIYGKVTLTRCTDSRGREHLVMLKE